MHNTDPQAAVDKVDLTNCDREPIHIPGMIQPFAALVAVSSDWIITHLSENASEVIGVEGLEIGSLLADVLPAEMLHTLRGKVQIGGRGDTLVRIFGEPIAKDGPLFDISVHRTDETLIIEFEPSQTDGPTADISDVQNVITRIAGETDNAVVYRRAVQGLRALTGFDRVMLYRFATDESGTVVAEACQPGATPYLGLRFPASDIPKQARALYLRSTLRIISDVDKERVAVQPASDPYGNPLDMSLAVSRAVSPIHLEYLRNMGVRASMSVSIIVKGKLWGLFACHHDTPHHLGFRQRTLCELFAQLFSYDIARREAEREGKLEHEANKLHQSLVARAARGTLQDNFEALSEEIATVVAFDGIAILESGRYQSAGCAPTEEEFEALTRQLNTTAAGQVYSTNQIAKSFPTIGKLSGDIAGILALPLSRKPRDYVVLFRREVVKQVHWAGDPSKPVQMGPNGAYLTPRASFDRWQEIIKNQSPPWSEAELRAADTVRVTLLEVVLKLSDAAEADRLRAREHQELLIAELNHRVRNILNLVRGLIRRGAKKEGSVEEVTQSLEARISALARAHNQLTASDWGVSSLREMIEIESDAFVGDAARRIAFDGADSGLTTEAFSSLALVIHELITNAVKYGALRDDTGKLTVATELAANGDLHMRWTENSSHPIEAVTTRGFGTSIVERSIPHELNGEAELEFREHGIEARFVIPAAHVRPVPEKKRQELRIAHSDVPTSVHAMPKRVLVVEDNVVIAMDLNGHLEDAGVEEIVIAPRVGDALKALEVGTFDAAVLDVNLGSETSEPVARALSDAGVPFVLVTGYAGEGNMLKNYPTSPVINKPFRGEDLVAMLKRLH